MILVYKQWRLIKGHMSHVTKNIGQIRKLFEHKIVIIFLPCDFGSKWEGSFEYPQQMVEILDGTNKAMLILLAWFWKKIRRQNSMQNYPVGKGLRFPDRGGVTIFLL